MGSNIFSENDRGEEFVDQQGSESENLAKENPTQVNIRLSRLSRDEAEILKQAIELLLLKRSLEEKIDYYAWEADTIGLGGRLDELKALESDAARILDEHENILSNIHIGTSPLVMFDMEQLTQIKSSLEKFTGKRIANPDLLRDAVREDLKKVADFIRNSYSSRFFKIGIARDELPSIDRELIRANGKMLRLLVSPVFNEVKDKITNARREADALEREHRKELREQWKKEKEELKIQKNYNKAELMSGSMAKSLEERNSMIAEAQALFDGIKKDPRCRDMNIEKYELFLFELEQLLLNLTALLKEMTALPVNKNRLTDADMKQLADLKETYLDKLNKFKRAFAQLERAYKSYLEMLDHPPHKVEKRKVYFDDIYGYQSSGGRKYGIYVGRFSDESSKDDYGTPLMMFAGDHCEYLSGNNKNDPLKIEKTHLTMNFDSDLFGLQPGDFCDQYGCKLPADEATFAAKCFQQVLNGIEILPSTKEPTGIRRAKTVGKKEESEQLKFRHWGQIFLSHPEQTVLPDKIEAGELLGAGGSYKAFTFGDKTVVEFDMEEHGTYLFDSSYFHSLRRWSRSKVLKEKPEGFKGRLIHNKNRQAWFDRIKDFLDI